MMKVLFILSLCILAICASKMYINGDDPPPDSILLLKAKAEIPKRVVVKKVEDALWKYGAKFLVPKKPGKYEISVKIPKTTGVKLKLWTNSAAACDTAVDGVMTATFGPMKYEFYKVLKKGRHNIALMFHRNKDVIDYYKDPRNSDLDEPPFFVFQLTAMADPELIAEIREKEASQKKNSKTYNEPVGQ